LADRRLIPWLLKLALATLLAGWLLGRLDGTELRSAFAGLSPGAFGLSLALLLPNLAFQYRRWALLVRSRLPAEPATRIWSSLLGGLALGTLTPGRLGEHGRAAWFNGARTELVALSLLDKLASAGVTGLVGAAGLLALPTWDLSIFGALAPVVLGALAVYGALVLAWSLAGLGLLLAPGRIVGWLRRLPWLGRSPRLERVHGAMRLIDRPRRLQLLLAAVGFYLVFLLQFVVLVRGLGFSSSHDWAAAAGTMFLKSLFPVSLGDIGVREVFAANLFQGLGARPETAVAAAFLLFAINLLLPSLAGLALWARRRRAS
jgi:glycosyltransferase 2 family protein